MPNETRILKVVSLFCGCGGLDFAFHKNRERFKIVCAIDFDKDSCASYEHYFGFRPIHQDIRTLDTIPDCDIMLGGFPC